MLNYQRVFLEVWLSMSTAGSDWDNAAGPDGVEFIASVGCNKTLCRWTWKRSSRLHLWTLLARHGQAPFWRMPWRMILRHVIGAPINIHKPWEKPLAPAANRCVFLSVVSSTWRCCWFWRPSLTMTSDPPRRLDFRYKTWVNREG